MNIVSVKLVKGVYNERWTTLFVGDSYLLRQARMRAPARAYALARETLPGLMVRATDQANEFDIHWYERNPDYDKYEQTFLLNVEVRRATVVTRAAAGPLGMRLLRA